MAQNRFVPDEEEDGRSCCLLSSAVIGTSDLLLHPRRLRRHRREMVKDALPAMVLAYGI